MVNDPEHPNNPRTDLKPLETAYQTPSSVLAATHSAPESELCTGSCFLQRIEKSSWINLFELRHPGIKQ